MTTLRQAAEQALEALEEMDSNDPELNQEWLGKQAITALRAALAEPEQENQALLEWKEKGEAIMAQAGIGFRLGEWWADRPWRKYE